MGTSELTYPGGADEVFERWEMRRDPFDFYEESPPDLAVDLDVLQTTLVDESATRRTPGTPGTPGRQNSYADKRRRVAEEFVGKSQLCYLNALLIANLRRRTQPWPIAELFQRIWKEKSDHLIAELDLRWKVSSVSTFADYGKTDQQRELGRGLQVLFGMMKLYEFERTHSGTHPKRCWSVQNRLRRALALDMEPFGLKTGGLDVAILAPLWTLAREEPVMGPLACDLLNALNRDNRNIFRRLQTMRTRAQALWGDDSSGNAG